MNSDGGKEYAAAALSGLKDFQRRTAEYAFERLFKAEDSTGRFLIADEVGLGKTLVAAGVLGLAVDHLKSCGTPRIDIIYICSNQAIARQNVNRIKSLLGIEARPLASRITLLPYRLDILQSPVNLVALTPGTSFGSASEEGVVEERIILYRMLRQAWGDAVYHHCRVFLGGLTSIESFQRHDSRILPRRIDPAITQRFNESVGVVDSGHYREFLQLGEALAAGPDSQARRRRRRFIANLRRVLARACLDSLEPDVVILDEFQRFRHLLDAGTWSGELAQRLFEYEDAHTRVRTMLLSATPYKMYTVSHETDDNHYRDFLSTVSFLQGAQGSVDALEESLRGFRTELPLAAAEEGPGSPAGSRLAAHRHGVQDELRKVMSRTERRGGDAPGDPMLAVRDLPVGLDAGDVESYLSARAISTAASAPGVMEYWKSAPYMLSFMDQYRLAERVRRAVAGEPLGEVAELVRGAAGLQLPRGAAAERLEIDGGNGRMRAVLSDLRESGLHDLLWLPPVLAGHELGPVFEAARGGTKRLMFSSWAMVPRAVSVMASYDAERRYIPERERAENYVPRALPVTRAGYALFALMLPAGVLAEAGDPYRYPSSDTAGLLRAIAEHLRPGIERITRDAPVSGQPQNIWYAVAPLLLNGDSPGSLWWLGDAGGTEYGGDGEDADGSVWRDMVASVRRGLADPSTLGRPPEDLLETLSLLSLGSPANASLRALSRILSLPTSDAALRRESLAAAWAFRSFFRSPACEGLLREVYRPSLPVNARTYIQRVLAYSAEGGLSAVLDEFFHVIRESEGGPVSAASLVAALARALRLATGRLDVVAWESDSDGVRRQPYAMRQHFARWYGNHAASRHDPQAGDHVDAVRSAFNSPFWPFVLASTSVGQEGLDFHWYCHAVVHWNLPSNPVDLEQREGRVHRYHGHAIRKNIAQALGGHACEETRASLARGELENPWDSAYRLADRELEGGGGLVPHWVFDGGDARIQRFAPVPPLSRDAARVDSLRRALAVYRMVFGQPRQDDLLDFILREVTEDRRDALAAAMTIDLTPPARSNGFRHGEG